MIPPIISLLVLLSSTLLLHTSSRATQHQQGLNKLSKQQSQQLKSSLTGRTLTGSWGCAQPLFFQSISCKYFSIPKDAKDMIIQPSEFNQPIMFFSNTNTGRVQGFFYTQQIKTAVTSQLNTNINTNRLYLLLYRDKYRTGQMIELDIDLSKSPSFHFSSQKNYTKVILWQQQNLITTANLYQNEKLFVKFDLSINLQIFVVIDDNNVQNVNGNNGENNELSKLVDDKSYIQSITKPIHIRIFSQSISIITQLQSPDNNSILMILCGLTLVQTIFICLNPITSHDNITKTRAIMFRISQWFILQMYAFIIIFSKQYIQIGLRYYDTDLGYLIFLGLGNVGIGLMFLRKYEMVLEKFTNWKILVIGIIYFSVYCYFANNQFHNGFFWVIELAVIMQLQILHSMSNGGKGGLPYDLMGFMIISRLPFIYMQLNESNIWNMPPIQITYIKLIGVTFVGYGIIIVLQGVKGGQFLVPNSIIPGYYNYYFTKSISDPKLQEQCPICTLVLNKSPDNIEMTETIIDSNQSSLHAMQSGQQISITQPSQSEIIQHKKKSDKNKQTNNNNTVKIMKTPCNHIFHIDCLTKWMQNKLVCPYCRTTLPQLAELEKE